MPGVGQGSPAVASGSRSDRATIVVGDQFRSACPTVALLNPQGEAARLLPCRR